MWWRTGPGVEPVDGNGCGLCLLVGMISLISRVGQLFFVKIVRNFIIILLKSFSENVADLLFLFSFTGTPPPCCPPTEV